MISQYNGLQLAGSEFPASPGRCKGSSLLTKINFANITKAQQDILKGTSKDLKRKDLRLHIATREDHIFAKKITDEMCASALVRGCGISRRSPLSVIRKMIEGKAIIAVTPENEWAGFSYIETYENNRFVSNSGLIVAPAFRACGIAKMIKQQIFNLSRKLYPHAKIFSITTGAAVMKMNTSLGFQPVTYQQITEETKFWEGCKSCVNYQTLLSKNCKNCFCTAMLYTPEQEETEEDENDSETEHHRLAQ